MNYLNKKLSPEEIKELSQTEVNLLFSQACFSNDDKLIKYLLTSPDLLKKIDLSINDNWFDSICRNGNINIVNFILTSFKTIEITQEMMNSGFIRACGKNRLELVKYLFTSDNVIIKPDIHDRNDYALIVSCIINAIDIMKYLLTSPDLKEHCNIHAKKDEVFKTICRQKNHILLEYVIFERRIEITDEIQEFLNLISNGKKTEHKLFNFCKQAEEKFSLRALEINLNKTMSISDKSPKPIKL